MAKENRQKKRYKLLTKIGGQGKLWEINLNWNAKYQRCEKGKTTEAEDWDAKKYNKM